MAGYEYNPLMPLNLQKRAKEVDPSQFATAAQGALADSALQNISGTGDSFVTVEVAEKQSASQSITIKTGTNTMAKARAFSQTGLATTLDVFNYLKETCLPVTGLSITDANGIFTSDTNYFDYSKYIPILTRIGTIAALPDHYFTATFVALESYRTGIFVYDITAAQPVPNTSIAWYIYMVNLKNIGWG